jgi:hypothetical protein
MGAHGGRCPATEHRCLLAQVLVERSCLVPVHEHAGPLRDLHVTSRIHHRHHQQHVARQALQLPLAPTLLVRGEGVIRVALHGQDLQRTEISSSRWRSGQRLPHHRRWGEGVDRGFLGDGLLCHASPVGGADGGCHIISADGRMTDPGIASAGLDGVWMTVMGLGGIATRAGLGASIAPLGSMPRGWGAVVAPGPGGGGGGGGAGGGGGLGGGGGGGGDDLGRRYARGEDMVVRVVYTIVLIDS